MISYKADVLLDISPSPQIKSALQKAAEIYLEHGIDLMVTAGCDGQHMKGSKHTTFRQIGPLKGVFDAFDLSVHGLTDPAKVVAEIALALGRDYDVVLEGANTPGSTGPHAHIEYQPKSK